MHAQQTFFIHIFSMYTTLIYTKYSTENFDKTVAQTVIVNLEQHQSNVYFVAPKIELHITPR